MVGIVKVWGKSLAFYFGVWRLGPQEKLDFIISSNIIIILGNFTVLLPIKISSYACSFRKRLTMTALLEYLNNLQDIGQKV